ncbi:molybdopterin-dependent oxidoreductase [Escherichia coli]|nr:molybdopterin-dependent oxidoreductase [Escherichia coli]
MEPSTCKAARRKSVRCRHRLLANGGRNRGVPVSDVRVISTQDTDVTPFDPGAFASRQSYVAAPALRSAALLLKRKSSLTPQSCYISQR